MNPSPAATPSIKTPSPHGLQFSNIGLLPAGINEAYPLEALSLERIRRLLLDSMIAEGYLLCMPPLIEFIDTLIEDAKSDLNIATFKLTDQLTGKMMGVRSDMTPQIARMDHHFSDKNAVSRLCYIGSTLKTRPDNFGGTRSPIQLGAEIYGTFSQSADLEIILLMLKTLLNAGIQTQDITLDIGHLAIFNQIVSKHQLDQLPNAQYEQVFDAIANKSAHNLPENLPKPARNDLFNLLELIGDESVLETASAHFPNFIGLTHVRDLCRQIKAFYPRLNVHIDFSELRGHRYYSGLIFGAFVHSSHHKVAGQAVALGGRYDDIGKHFAYKRPAVGFSTDLRKLLHFTPAAPSQPKVILAPAFNFFDAELESLITSLRQQGDIVIRDLQMPISNLAITHILIKNTNETNWHIDAK